MKILKISFCILIILYLGVLFWWDDNPPLKPLPWLIVQLVFAAIVIALMIASVFINKRKLTFINILSLFLVTVNFGYFFGYKEILKYKNYTSSVKYGPAYNAIRQALGISKIPSDWHVRIRYDGEFIWSKDKNDTIGHISKRIDIDSANNREDDDYRFKQVNGVSRYLLISAYYANNNHLDSIIYYYSKSHGGNNISRQQADSLFAAEKIEKDY